MQDEIDAVFAERPDNDIIGISSEVNRDLHIKISNLIKHGKTKDNCTLILTTYGGDPDGAYRIARCLRHHYKQVRVVVPSFCKSAGTLITIVADELAIGDLGELGPLDIQVRKDSELAGRSSGLDITQALQATFQHAQQAFRQALVDLRHNAGLSTKLAGEFATNIAIGVAAPMYAQIDPVRLGEMQRAMRIAYEYGTRLNAYTNSLLDGALERLTIDYPAHGFVIDRKEAKEIFRTVQTPSRAEEALCAKLWNIFGSQGNWQPDFIKPISVASGAINGSNPEISGTPENAEREPEPEDVPADPTTTNGQRSEVREDG